MLREDATGQLNLALWKHDSLLSSFQLYRLGITVSHGKLCYASAVLEQLAWKEATPHPLADGR